MRGNMFVTAVAALASVAWASAASAHWEGAEIGMSFSDARALYPEAVDRQDRATGAHTLNLPGLDLYGAHWRSAALVFDPQGRLDRVQLKADRGDYDALSERLHQPVQPGDDPSGEIRVSDDQDGAMSDANAVDIMLCENSDATIVATFIRAGLIA